MRDDPKPTTAKYVAGFLVLSILLGAVSHRLFAWTAYAFNDDPSESFHRVVATISLFPLLLTTILAGIAMHNWRNN